VSVLVGMDGLACPPNPRESPYIGSNIAISSLSVTLRPFDLTDRPRTLANEGSRRPVRCGGRRTFAASLRSWRTLDGSPDQPPDVH
jgi:hypothetical protein